MSTIKKTAARSHGINSKYFGKDPEIKLAITSLLWISQGEPHKAEYSYTKASSLVKPLANLGIKEGWKKNSPKALLDAAAKAMPKASQPKPQPKGKVTEGLVKAWAAKQGGMDKLTPKQTVHAKALGMIEAAEAAADAPMPQAKDTAEQVSTTQQIDALTQQVTQLTALVAKLANK